MADENETLERIADMLDRLVAANERCADRVDQLANLMVAKTRTAVRVDGAPFAVDRALIKLERELRSQMAPVYRAGNVPEWFAAARTASEGA